LHEGKCLIATLDAFHDHRSIPTLAAYRDIAAAPRICIGARPLTRVEADGCLEGAVPNPGGGAFRLGAAKNAYGGRRLERGREG
jgi:hypothetical protein